MGRLIARIQHIWQHSMMYRAMMVAPPVALLIWVAYVSLGGNGAVDYFTAKVDKGDISQVVQSVGTINPITSTAVGSVVSGDIVKLNVDFNSMVKKGDILAVIDPTPFQIAVDQAKANYDNAVANVASLEAQIGTAKANVDSMKANVAKAVATEEDMKTQWVRTGPLADEGVLSAQQKDDAKANYDAAVAGTQSAKAQEVQSEAQFQATIAQREQAKAQVAQQKAVLANAQLNLSYTNVRTPVDGTIINRSIDVGQPVAATLQAPNLFTVGQDLTHMRVYTNTDESDVGRIRVGARAQFRVDAFPRETFFGSVEQIRMYATTVQNVVTYNIVIAFDNPDLRLFPGMTAYATIPIAEARDAIKIPQGALRYKPDLSSSEINALYAKYGIQQGANLAARGGQGGGNRQPGQGGGGRPSGGGGFRGAGGGRGGSGANSQRADTGIVWKLDADKTIEPVQVALGVTDGSFTAMTAGKLDPGDELVIGEANGKSSAANQQGARNPLTPQGGPGRGLGRF